MTSKVEFKNRAVIIDGKPVQIIAGAMHYFRVPREYWRDRMQKAVQIFAFLDKTCGKRDAP